MTAVPQSKISNLTGLARKIVVDGLLKPEEAEQAFDQALKERIPFVSYLVKHKLVGSYEVAWAAAQEFGLPLIDIESVELQKETIKKIDEKLLRKHNLLPLFERGNRLIVAISDPTNLIALDEIKFHTKKNTEAVLAEEDKLNKVIERALEAFDDSMKDLEGDLADVDLVADEGEKKSDEDKEGAEEAPIVKFVNKMLYDAIKIGASDLHFEPYEKFYRVRFRIDGMLRIVAQPPVGLSRKLSARLKVMSRLDIAERRIPQDGRIKIKYGKGAIDFRVSTMPTLYGEKVVLRILDSSAANLNIEKLGYEDEQKRLYLEALDNPYGMVLVTGPTGSGKTVSLYTGINILNKEVVNICTAEDPVEINLPGVNQVQVDEKTGMTFAKALKAFLRQDPDIILVGEIRDIETGGIAIKAATTGHMVMSTLHTNDAPQTLTRMIDMGIPPFAIATAVNLIMAQRLCRRLCVCKVEQKDIPEKLLLQEGFDKQDIPTLKLYTVNPQGCERCNKLGYKGRVGIYQVMPISEPMKRLIMGGSNAIALADQARKEGIPDLRKSGLKKVKDGLTSLTEVNRVVNKEKEREE